MYVTLIKYPLPFRPPPSIHPQIFLNSKILHHTYHAKVTLETAVIQELVDEGRRELDAKRSMVRHVSHEIRYDVKRCGREGEH